MASQEFVFWLKGFVAGSNNYNLTPAGWESLQKQLEEVNDIKQYPVFSTNDRASVIITKPNPKKRKGKTVQEWEDEIDLGHAG